MVNADITAKPAYRTKWKYAPFWCLIGINDQLKRATFSILLNLAEGSSRFSNADRRRFMIMARGSVFECVAVIDFLVDNKLITQSAYDDFFNRYEEISKMLYSLIKRFTEKTEWDVSTKYERNTLALF